jgi:DnaJ-class molecular chaperone
MANYYDILGVPRNASGNDLKNAFKKKAMQYHPDRGGNEEQFKQINEAYDCLKDPQKKSMYDQFGTADPQQRPRGQEYHFHGDHNINVEDIFNNFFGEGQGNSFFGGGFNQRRPTRGQNITIAADVNLEDVVNGKTLIATFRLQNGQEKTVNIDIPRGVKHGDTILFKGMGGNEYFPGRQPGDLHVKIRIKRHPIYDVDGTDLYITKNVDLFDLILGTNIKVDTIHGKKLNVTVPAGSNPGTMYSIHEQGLPDHRSGITGRLFVKVNGITPKVTNEKAREGLRKIQNETDKSTK